MNHGWLSAIVALSIGGCSPGSQPATRDSLDAVAREKRYLAQIEALPLEKVEAFVRESVATDAVQFVALDGGRTDWLDYEA